MNGTSYCEARVPDERFTIHDNSGASSGQNNRAFLLLGLMVFLIYLLSSPWRFPLSSDGQAMLATSHSILVEQTLAIAPSFASDDGYSPSAKIGIDGRAYSKYGLGLPLLELPFVGLGLLINKLTGLTSTSSIGIAVSLLNPMITAITAVLLGKLCQSLGSALSASVTVALGYSFGTLAWPYAVTDGAEALQSLCFVGSVLLLIWYRSQPKMIWIVGSGVILAYAILTKLANVIIIPALLVYLFLIFRPAHRSPRELVFLLLQFLSPTAVCLLVLAILNRLRFGSFGESGYNSRMFSTPWGRGLYGLLVSPNKGLIFYAPLVLLALLGLWRMWHHRPAETTAIFLLCLTVILFNARFFDWGGGWCWGPRYLVPIVPLMLVPLAARVTGWEKYIGAGFFIAGLVINSLGVLIDEFAYRQTTMKMDLTVALPTVLVGSVQDKNALLEFPAALEDVVPEFSSIAGHYWLGKVALSGCECSHQTNECRCQSGDFEEHPVFLSPPWIHRYPEATPTPPYGIRIIRPWLAERLYEHFMPARQP